MREARKASRGTNLPLAESLEKRLAVYALTAGAAGVGVLALTPLARADIVVNTNSISIGVNTTEYLTINGLNRIEFVDRNVQHQIVAVPIVICTLEDCTVLSSPFGAAAEGSLLATGAQIAQEPFAFGSSIGNDYFNATLHVVSNDTKLAFNSFLTSNGFANSTFTRVGGPWANKAGYLGFKFNSGAGATSETHFGWAHLSVAANIWNGETGFISEFAYDTCPGEAITAGQTSGGACSSPTIPEPPTLALLALGAAGLLTLRRKKLAASN